MQIGVWHGGEACYSGRIAVFHPTHVFPCGQADAERGNQMNDGERRCWNGMSEAEVRTIMEHRIEQWLLTTRTRAEARRQYRQQQQQPQAAPVRPDLLRVGGTKQDRRSDPAVRARLGIVRRQYWINWRAARARKAQQQRRGESA